MQKEKQSHAEEIVLIESDVESNAGLDIDEPTEEAAKDNSAQEQVVQ